MSEEDLSGGKLNKLAGAKDLSKAIRKLERKKVAMEEDFKDHAHSFLKSLHPINVLDETLRNVKKSSSSKYTLFKEAFAFGSGYLSKKKLIRWLKSSVVGTFRKPVSESSLGLKETADKNEDFEINGSSTDNKKEYNYMDTQNEKVKAKPEVLPEPTYWPFFLAMGLAFLGWGLLTTWLISLAGFIILIVALTGWINILRHE